VKRLLPLVAVVLLVAAAAGLSSNMNDDYCITHYATEENAPSLVGDYSLWPPGLNCVYTWDDGHSVTLMRGSVAGFLILLAGGLPAVVRRTRYAWASLIVLGVSGAIEFYAPAFQLLMMAAFISLPIAFVATRNVVATATAGAVLFVGAFAFLAGNRSTLGWAVLLALVAVAENVLDPLEKRVMGELVGPRPELE
jgi:hypothetical protein